MNENGSTKLETVLLILPRRIAFEGTKLALRNRKVTADSNICMKERHTHVHYCDINGNGVLQVQLFFGFRIQHSFETMAKTKKKMIRYSKVRYKLMHWSIEKAHDGNDKQPCLYALAQLSEKFSIKAKCNGSHEIRIKTSDNVKVYAHDTAQLQFIFILVGFSLSFTCFE